jgi:hypothetical protein
VFLLSPSSAAAAGNPSLSASITTIIVDTIHAYGKGSALFRRKN